MKHLEMPPLMELEGTIAFVLAQIAEATEAKAVQLQMAPEWIVLDAQKDMVKRYPVGQALQEPAPQELISLGELRGKLLVCGGRELSQGERDALALFCGRAISNADIYEKWKQKSVVDRLTMLINRGTWEERLAEEVERNTRLKGKFTIALFDMDDFKMINDSFGHLVGDEALKQVAAALRRNVRQYDVLGRYGGDEFVILFPDTVAIDASKATARIAASLAAVAINGANLAISYGLAMFPEDGTEPKELLKVADSRMYEQKKEKKQVRKIGG